MFYKQHALKTFDWSRLCWVHTGRSLNRVLQQFKHFSRDLHTKIFVLLTVKVFNGTDVNRHCPLCMNGHFELRFNLIKAFFSGGSVEGSFLQNIQTPELSNNQTYHYPSPHYTLPDQTLSAVSGENQEANRTLTYAELRKKERTSVYV